MTIGSGNGGVPEKQVREWLSEHGYPLELRVAQAFKRAGAHVLPTRYFEEDDADGVVVREIDVVASFDLPSIRRMRRPIAVTYVIECKSPEYPWVALNDPLPGPFPWGLVTERVYHPSWADRVRSAAHTALIPVHIRDLAGDRVGYSLFVAKPDGKNRNLPYGALQSAAKAAQWFAEEGFRWEPAWPRLFIPAVVVGNDLWTCHLRDDEDDLRLDRVETMMSMRMVLPPRSPREPIMFDVVPASGLDRYVAHCAQFAEVLAEHTEVI